MCDDAIYFDHPGDCRDARYHKGCPGRWRGAVSLGYGPDGKRIRRKVGCRTKQEVKDKLEELHADLKAGIPPRTPGPDEGRGTGSTLLRFTHQRLDATRTPAYLEASSPRARDLYLRHGYTLLPGTPFHLPGGGPLWPMWRQPRTHGQDPECHGRSASAERR